MSTATTHFKLDCRSPAWWRVTFDHPPINTVTATTIRELFDGPRAELYGYVNRAIADDELDEEVEAIASRLARFDREAIARTKSYVDQITLPPDSELPPALTDFRQAAGRPGPRARLAKLEELGLNVDSDLERRLGKRVVEAAPDLAS